MSQTMNAVDFRAAMTDAYHEKSGFVPQDASDLGLRMSVLAHQLETLAKAVAAAGQNVFPQTAAGEALDLLAEARGITRRPALPAGGRLRFSRSTPADEDIAIPAGTLCAGAGAARFATTQDAVMAGGESSVTVPAAAVQPGPEGNIPALAVRVIISPVAGIAAVGNPSPFAGGSPRECDEHLRERLLRRMADPPSSFNAAFYRETALVFPGAGSVQVLPMRRGAGTVDVFVSALPGYRAQEVAGRLQAAFSSAREIGTDVNVAGADILPVELACVVRAARGWDVPALLDACRAAIAGVMAAQQVGQGLPVARLHSALMGVEGIENIRLVAPAADIPAREGQLLAAGEIEVAAGVLGMPEVNAR